MRRKLRWSELMYLAIVGAYETDKTPFTIEAAEATLVHLEHPAAQIEDPDQATERRFVAEAAKRLGSFRDARSPRFGEGLEKARRKIATLAKAGLVLVDGDHLFLTSLGRAEVAVFMGRNKGGRAS